MVEIVLDYRQLENMLKPIENIKNGVPRVLVPTINRTVANGVTTVKREIRKVYEIKYKDIPVRKETAHYGKLEGAVVIEQGMLDLGKFDVSPRTVQTGKGGRLRRMIFARVKKGHGGMLLGGFMANLPYKGPWRRVGKARLPIKKMLTIGAGIMASQPSVGPAVSKSMGETFAKRLEHEIDRVWKSHH